MWTGPAKAWTVGRNEAQPELGEQRGAAADRPVPSGTRKTVHPQHNPSVGDALLGVGEGPAVRESDRVSFHAVSASCHENGRFMPACSGGSADSAQDRPQARFIAIEVLGVRFRAMGRISGGAMTATESDVPGRDDGWGSAVHMQLREDGGQVVANRSSRQLKTRRNPGWRVRSRPDRGPVVHGWSVAGALRQQRILRSPGAQVNDRQRPVRTLHICRSLTRTSG